MRVQGPVAGKDADERRRWDPVGLTRLAGIDAYEGLAADNACNISIGAKMKKLDFWGNLGNFDCLLRTQLALNPIQSSCCTMFFLNSLLFGINFYFYFIKNMSFYSCQCELQRSTNQRAVLVALPNEAVYPLNTYLFM